METLKRNKKLVVLITYTVFLFFFLFNIDRVNAAIGIFFDIIMPVIYGMIFAFLAQSYLI